jgi:hypothetical protein
LDVLALGGHLFARAAGDESGGPVAIHARSPEHGAPLEWGTAVSIGESWTTVPLTGNYDSPVVVAKPVVAPGAQPFSVRVRGATANAFEVRCEPWSVGESCADVRVSYLVAEEEGAHELAGLAFRAGTLETGRRFDEGWHGVGLGAPFRQVPVVLAGLQTDNNPGVRARIHNRNADWFDVGLEYRLAAGGALVPETVGWIAFEPGTVTTSDGRRVEAVTESVGASASPDQPRPARERPPALPGVAREAKTVRVTVAETGSTYIQEPTLVCLDPGAGTETVVVAPRGKQTDVAEDVCVLRAA